MFPVIIKIFGDYYDCQLYRGRLYLWTFDGKVLTYDWNKIVEGLIKRQEDDIAFRFSFIDCNYLYNPAVQELIQDSDIFKLLKVKFKTLSEYRLELSSDSIKKALIGEQDVLLNSLPIDTEVFGNTLYTANEMGLYSAKVHSKHTEKPISKKPTTLWDCRLLSIKASRYGQIALSAGSEGLYEFKTNKYDRDKQLKEIEKKTRIYSITENHSEFANFSSISIYNSSSLGESLMALFEWQKVERGRKKWQRTFSHNVIGAEKIFKKSGGLSWGSGDKIYRQADNGLDVIRFNNLPKDEAKSYFAPIKTIPLKTRHGAVIGGGVANFGTIVEMENGLLVELSDNKSHFEIDQPVTRWRVYPRAKLYTNQLHAILEDHIQIISFNHDFFIDQESKVFGTAYNTKDLDAQPTSNNRFSWRNL